MIPVAITQRVAVAHDYAEKRDCLDQQWYSLLETAGVLPVPVPNRVSTPPDFFRSLSLRGLVLTGGNDLGEEPDRDRCERECLNYCCENHLPVLGICRGLQLINSFFGGSLTTVEGHVAIRHGLRPLEEGLPNEVNSFHGFRVDRLGSGLRVIAEDPQGRTEALRHNSLPIWGIMWHPEREKPFSQTDIDLIRRVFGSPQ